MSDAQPRLTGLLLGFFCSLPVLAAPVGLREAHEAALRHDPVLRTAAAERDISREQAVLGRAQLMPSLSAHYSNSLNHADVTDAAGSRQPRQYRSVNASVQLRQPLYHPEGQAAQRQGQALAAAGEAQFAARRQELIVRVFEAYAATLYAQEQVVLAQSQFDTLVAQMRTHERLLAGGEGTRTEVLESLARMQLAQAQWIEARDALAQQRRLLTDLTGLPVDSVLSLREPMVLDLDPASTPAAWQASARTHHPLLQSLHLQVQASEEDVRRADSGHHPRLDLVASTGRSESDTVSTYRQTQQVHTLGLQLSIPLYAGGSVSALARQAVARLHRAQAERDARTAEVLAEVQRQQDLLQSSTQRIQALEQALASSQLLVDATQKSVTGGIRTNLDVLTARDQVTQARRDLTQARLSHLLARLRLRLAAGVLSDDDLHAMAERFAQATAP